MSDGEYEGGKSAGFLPRKNIREGEKGVIAGEATSITSHHVRETVFFWGGGAAKEGQKSTTAEVG